MYVHTIFQATELKTDQDVSTEHIQYPPVFPPESIKLSNYIVGGGTLCCTESNPLSNYCQTSASYQKRILDVGKRLAVFTFCSEFAPGHFVCSVFYPSPVQSSTATQRTLAVFLVPAPPSEPRPQDLSHCPPKQDGPCLAVSCVELVTSHRPVSSPGKAQTITVSPVERQLESSAHVELLLEPDGSAEASVNFFFCPLLSSRSPLLCSSYSARAKPSRAQPSNHQSHPGSSQIRSEGKPDRQLFPSHTTRELRIPSAHTPTYRLRTWLALLRRTYLRPSPASPCLAGLLHPHFPKSRF